MGLKQFSAIDFTCPHCRAKVGKPCLNKTLGVVQNDFHDSREKKAEAATLRWNAWHGDKDASARVPPL